MLDRSHLNVLAEHLIRTAGWAGSGYNTLLPPDVCSTPGVGSQSREPLHGWDRYIQLVAEAYKDAPLKTSAGAQAYIAFKEHILRIYKRLNSKVEVRFVEYDPYPSAEDMQRRVEETGVLEITKMYNQSEAFGPEVNLMMRAVHDFSAHLGSNPHNKPKPFGFKGELQAYLKHLALMGQKSRGLGAVYTDIVGQLCYFFYFGHFPDQKIVVFPQFDWVRLGAVDGYRIENGDLVSEKG